MATIIAYPEVRSAYRHDITAASARIEPIGAALRRSY